MKKRLMFFAALVVAALSLSMAASSGFAASSAWHVGYYNPSDNALSNTQATTTSTGIASLNFTSQDNTALLVTSQKVKNSPLLGNMTGKTITADASIGDVTGAFTYYGEPSCGGRRPTSGSTSRPQTRAASTIRTAGGRTPLPPCWPTAH
jgi:hypothetical protein